MAAELSCKAVQIVFTTECILLSMPCTGLAEAAQFLQFCQSTDVELVQVKLQMCTLKNLSSPSDVRPRGLESNKLVPGD